MKQSKNTGKYLKIVLDSLEKFFIVDKLTDISKGLAYRNVTDQPLFYIALVAIIVGFQLFLTGFIAELVSRNAPERNHYHIGDKV